MACGQRLFVIDCDPGVDDCQAVVMMLNAERRGEIRLLAITSVKGNVSLDQGTNNVLQMLKVAQRLDIHVYRGARTALVDGEEHPHAKYHGNDGLGDVNLPPVDYGVKSEAAALALVRLAQEHKGLLNILALGPLTNLALAVSIDDSFVHNVQHFYVMGGNEGPGNVTTTAEFNFQSDPEAAVILLRSVPKPITLVTWNTCLQHSLPLEWRKQLGSETAVGQFLNKIEHKQLSSNTFGSWVTCDQLAAAVALRPQLVTRSSECHATVELTGQHTRGQMVVEKRHWITVPRRNALLVESVNMELYRQMLTDVFREGDAASF